jgi:hypothetical protein
MFCTHTRAHTSTHTHAHIHTHTHAHTHTFTHTPSHTHTHTCVRPAAPRGPRCPAHPSVRRRAAGDAVGGAVGGRRRPLADAAAAARSVSADGACKQPTSSLKQLAAKQTNKQTKKQRNKETNKRATLWTNWTAPGRSVASPDRSAGLPFVCLFACLFTCLFACSLVCLFACLLVCFYFPCLFVSLFAYLLVCLLVCLLGLVIGRCVCVFVPDHSAFVVASRECLFVCRLVCICLFVLRPGRPRLRMEPSSSTWRSGPTRSTCRASS